MAKNKTTETDQSVSDFLDAIADDVQRADSYRLIKLMQAASGYGAKMWGPSIIGFGSYHYRYESGHEGDAALIAFSPRKSAISLYLMQDPDEKELLLKSFGKHKTGKGCIYIKKLSDINEVVLKELITASLKYMRAKYPVA